MGGMVILGPASASQITQDVGEQVTSLLWSLCIADTVQGERHSRVAQGQLEVNVHWHQARPGWSLLTELSGQDSWQVEGVCVQPALGLKPLTIYLCCLQED